jgi:hypothetical protein
MGIERLNSAARAAGFAMAGTEETFDDVEQVLREPDVQWRPGEAVLIRDRPQAATEWVRAVLTLFGLRAPASPA